MPARCTTAFTRGCSRSPTSRACFQAMTTAAIRCPRSAGRSGTTQGSPTVTVADLSNSWGTSNCPGPRCWISSCRPTGAWEFRMPPEDTTDSAAILARAEARAKQEGVAFRGLLMPEETWALFKKGEIELVDTRTLAERDLVGYVPG